MKRICPITFGNVHISLNIKEFNHFQNEKKMLFTISLSLHFTITFINYRYII